MEFDFVRSEVLLHDPRSFRGSGGGSILDMVRDETGTHSIPLSFVMSDGRSFSGRADIDFGGIYAFKIALNNSLDIPLPGDARPTASRGAQGRQNEFTGRIRNFTIGDLTFDDPVVHFGDAPTSVIHRGNLGVVGLPLFMEFRTVFDYLKNRLYLEPAGATREE